MDAIERGNLAQKAVLPLLADLYHQGATGSLRLERAPLQKAVYFRDGQILFAASNDPKDQLASILVEEGKLSPDQMQLARARVSAGNPLAKILTELGYISQRELADAARLKVEKILTDLFTWKEGTYQFAEKALPKGAIDLELSTRRLLFNSIRRIEDRTWILEEVGSLETVLSPAESLNDFIAETEPDDKALKVVRAVDGTKTIKQISDSSSLGDFEVSKIIVAALMIGAFQKGAVEPEAAPASIPADEEAFSVEAADVISFQVSDPGDDEEPLEQTVVDTEAAPFSFSQEEPSAPLVPSEPETPLEPSEPQPPLVPSESQPPLVPSESQPPLVSPESQPPLVSPEPDSPLVSPESQPPLVFPESKPPLVSPVPPPPFESAGVSGLLIDEPETDGVKETPQRTPPRPRQTGRAPEGGAGKKVVVAVAAILLLVVGGLAGYYFIWPMFSSGPTTEGTETPSSTPSASSRPQQPSATTAGAAPSSPSAAPGTTGTSGSSPAPTSTAPPPTPGRPGQTQPTSPTPSATKPSSPPPKPGPPRPSPAAPSSTVETPARPTPSPSPAPSQPSPSRPATGSSTSGQELLRNGQYSEAARSYLQQLKSVGTNKFTIAVGVYCDVANVGRAFRDSGNSSDLIVLPYQYQGRSCYRVFWGIYDSEEAARRNLASVPAAIRSSQSVPVPTSRLTR